MICEFCNNNEASIHLVKIINNCMEKLNLCAECVKNFSFTPEDDFFSDLNDLISKVFEIDIKIIDKSIAGKLFSKIDSSDNKKCSYCGIDLNTIKAIGKVGCAKCYNEFRDSLYPLIKSIHGNIEHKGKAPSVSSDDIKLEKEIRDLKFKLKEEITVENFEEAAKLRDTIKRLQRRFYIGKK
jgi:protein arginine kinase activator